VPLNDGRYNVNFNLVKKKELEADISYKDPT